MSVLPAEDRQRLTEQLTDLQITLGHLRQIMDDVSERLDIANAQMKTITDILYGPHGHRAPQSL
jgi:hypothetical protein